MKNIISNRQEYSTPKSEVYNIEVRQMVATSTGSGESETPGVVPED